jgi:replicative DNA helicase
MTTAPNNMASEKSIIGSILLDPSAFHLIENTISESDFYSQKHGKTFAILEEMHKNSEKIDIVTLSVKLKNI